MNQKEKIIEYIKENLTITNDPHDAIYIIDNIMVSGEFDCGVRGLDHNALLDDDISWEDLINYGTIIVPENQEAIGYLHESLMIEIGYTMLPLNANHIMGY